MKKRVSSDVVDCDGVVRTYNGRPHLRPRIDASHDGRTKSEFAKSCDLKDRIRVYQERGVLPGMRQPFSEANAIDLSAYPDSYHEALDLVSRVGQHFAGLPSQVRTQFHNDPRLYLADLEAQQKASLEAAAKASNLSREAFQYDIEDKIASGRQKASERDKRVKEAMKDPTPPKKGE